MVRWSGICLSLCFLVLFHGCVTQAYRKNYQSQQQSECQLQRLNAAQPNQRIESEGGVTEHWDENDDQFQCAGVAATRHTIQPKGLLLPQFSNSPKLTYIVQGRGIQGAVIPGCPETYEQPQQSQQSQGGERQLGFRDRHQKIKDLRQGDIVATPAGVAHWLYNDGNRPLVLVTIHDTGSAGNQLDETRRTFFLAGNPQQQGQQQHWGSEQEQQGHQRQQEQQGGSKEEQQEGEQQRGSGQEQDNQSNNIFQPFDDQILAKAFGVKRETVRKLKSQNDRRGMIVRVENGLQYVRPPSSEQEEDRQQGQQGEQRQGQQQGKQGQEQQQKSSSSNGIEETLCTIRYRENIGEPIRADEFNPQGGRLRSINSGTLPILELLQLSAERGVLYSNALMVPHWNMNAHSVIYCTGGSARVQVVGNYQRPVFDGQLREGQLLIVPQNFAVVKQAGNNGFEWVAFKTNANAMTSPVAGKTSALAAMPVDVLVNAYQGLSRQEAMNLKNNRRRETLILSPSFSSQGGSYSA